MDAKISELRPKKMPIGSGPKDAHRESLSDVITKMPFNVLIDNDLGIENDLPSTFHYNPQGGSCPSPAPVPGPSPVSISVLTHTLSCPITFDALLGLLRKHDLNQWTTNRRVSGLLLILDYIANPKKRSRNRKRSRGPAGVNISKSLSLDYCSQIVNPTVPGTGYPLQVLVKIGVLVVVQPHVYKHVRRSARYDFAPDYKSKNTDFSINLSRSMAYKIQNHALRLDNRKNKYCLARPGIMASLNLLNISDAGREISVRLRADPRFSDTIKSVSDAIYNRRHDAWTSPSGTIFTSISSCPKELKPSLLIDGRRVALCDISHAHHCFLPRLLDDRIRYLARGGCVRFMLDRWESEKCSLINRLSDGDWYSHFCVDPFDPEERTRKKLELTQMVNMKNCGMKHLASYGKFREQFPLLCTIIEDIKKNDHSNISKFLQRYMASAMNQAMSILQEYPGGTIFAIPDTDSIICQDICRSIVCEVIGEAVFAHSCGVRCKVGGIRYAGGTPQDKEVTEWGRGIQWQKPAVARLSNRRISPLDKT